MKIKAEHMGILHDAIAEVLYKYPNLVEEYETGKFPRSDKVKDLQKRFCFDVLYGAGISKWVCDELYPYMNDDHLYTALRNCCPVITRRY